jgi:hypothetical protein
MYGSRSKIPSKSSRQAALRGGINSCVKGLINTGGRSLEPQALRVGIKILVRPLQFDTTRSSPVRKGRHQQTPNHTFILVTKVRTEML